MPGCFRQLDFYHGLFLGQIQVLHLLPEQKHLVVFPLSESGNADFAPGGLFIQHQALVSGVGQHLHGVVHGLGDAALAQHAKAAVEFLGEGMELLKHVGEAPDRGAVHAVHHVQRGFYVIRGHLAGVVGIGAKAGVFIPFSIVQWHIARLLTHNGGIAEEAIVWNVSLL